MGDRVSIQFVNPDEPDWGQKSVVLFSHWQGMHLVEEANNYVKELTQYAAEQSAKRRGDDPLTRLEPNTVMVDFIRHITQDLDRVDGDLYFGATSHDGDNGDNGHHDIILKAGIVVAR